MRACDCISEPPLFDLPPPPDPSLIWHLISDEKFEPAEQCSSNQFVSISDIGTIYDSEDRQQLAANILIAIAGLSVLLLLAVCFAVIGRIRRRRRENASKKMSSDSILAAGENFWTYNSMKQQHPNGTILMYSNNTNNTNSGSRLFHHTPTTMRSYVVGSGTPIMNLGQSLRHSESTTLRLNPGEGGSAYHTVSINRQNAGIPPSEVYEEIAPIGPTSHMGYMTTRPHSSTTPMNNLNSRMSLRKPPPTCRPPQPPQSPVPSDGSYEITRITGPGGVVSSESPRQWNEDGRESGYGTAPSLQWKSPSGSGRLEAEAAARAMTYV